MRAMILVMVLWLGLPKTMAQLLTQEVFNTHLRLNLFVQKEQIQISKTPEYLLIETLDSSLYHSLVDEVEALPIEKKYFEYFEKSEKNYPQKPLSLKWNFSQKGVDLFSFYKETEKKYILDLWQNMNILESKNEEKSSSLKIIADDSAKKIASIPKESVKKPTRENEKIPHAVEEKPVTPSDHSVEKNYRDFRYGAAFIWDYPPLIPPIQEKMDIESKTPAYFYPILNRDYKKNKEETYIQYIVNLFNKDNYGLMHKSIEIYQKKFGEEKNADLFDFLKSTAILRKNLTFSGKNSNEGEIKMAIAVYENILERTGDKELKEAILRYFIDYYKRSENYLFFLDYSKKLYLLSRENFDRELELDMIDTILYGLAKLDQIENLEKFMDNEFVKTQLTESSKLSFLSYAYMRKNLYDKVISLYEKGKDLQIKNLPAPMVFNIAEAYFRLANYQKAMTFFKHFIEHYSMMSYTSLAINRVALCQDLLGYPFENILSGYKDAINSVSLPYYRFEAKVRYIGALFGRKKELSEKDKEEIIYIDAEEEEKKSFDFSLKKLLWLVRLRTFIIKNEYQNALTYLRSIPVKTMLPVEAKVFYNEGSEVVHGIISSYYNEMNYVKVTEIWENEKDHYFQYSNINPALYYKVAHSFLQMGLPEMAKKVIDHLKSPADLYNSFYPKWVVGPTIKNSKTLSQELEILQNIQKENFQQALSLSEEMKKNDPQYYKTYYYLGYLFYQTGDYDKSVKNIQDYLLQKEKNIILTHLEVSNLFTAYVESLYHIGNNEKFVAIAEAVLKDLEGIKKETSVIINVKERVSYLLTEFLMSDEKMSDWNRVITLITSFQKKFPQSVYLGRMRYLLGVVTARSGDTENAEKILKELIKDDTISQYIKEMSKTELSSLKLNKQQFI